MKPRLAEDAESLWRAIQSLGEKISGAHWVFPVINAIGTGTFILSKDGKLTRIIKPAGGMGIYLNQDVPLSVADEVHDSIAKDQVQVEYWPRMGSTTKWYLDSIVHSPSGMSFKSD